MNIKEIRIEQKKSKKTGDPYNVLVVVTEAGYTCELFLTNEQVFCLTHK